MAQSISNMNQVWMSNTNTYNAIAMTVSTLGYGANTNSTILKMNVDGNTKFKVDASGNVGILTNTTSFPLQIGYASPTGSINGQLAIAKSQGGGYRYMVLGYDDAFNFCLKDSSGSSQFKINYNASDSSLAIDSSGRVTKPYQPFFMGYPTTDYSGGSMPTQMMAVTASYNNGNHFNASNNRFTCPITGWYRVTWGGLQLQPTVTSLAVNGSNVYNGNHYAGSYPSYITMTQTVLRQFSAGDYLQIYQWNGGGYYNGWWLWSVELVG